MVTDIQKIEYNGITVLTTQQIADAYETNTDTITKNFNRNKERYTEGKHYICLKGDELKEFRANGQIDLSPNTHTFYLWTKKGAFLHAKSLNTDNAWELYDALVDNYFDKQSRKIDTSKLSPELQMFYVIADAQAKQELEQKRQAEQINKVEMTVTTMRDIFTEPIGDWQNDINKRVREIAMKSGTPFNEMWGKLYGELEVTAHCSLKRLAENKKKRMKKAGNTEQAIKKGTSKLAIIHDNTRLKLIFEDIVKKYAMAYVGVAEKAEV